MSGITAIKDRRVQIQHCLDLPGLVLATVWHRFPWRQIARMRVHLAHRYFDIAHAILQSTVDDDLPALERAIQALIQALPLDEDTDPQPGAEQRAERLG